MGLTVKWAGVDVTAYVDEATIDIKDALGQGAGAKTGISGRSATLEFYTTLGPIYTAVGAGTKVSTPQIVRMGEVDVYDTATGWQMFGGVTGQLQDMSTNTGPQGRRVKVDCYDWWQHLDRIMLDEVFNGYTDIQTIQVLCRKYAPFLKLTGLAHSANMQFTQRYYRNMSLQKALQQVADEVGFLIWVDWDKTLRYTSPAAALASPFALSDVPNYTTSFPFTISHSNEGNNVYFDDQAAIDRVFVFGGKTPVKDFSQDLSMYANSSNVTFPLTYYPHASSDGKVHVTVGGVQQVVGSATGQTVGPITKYNNPAKNILKSAGGLADVLINYDAHTLTFNTPPATGATVVALYSYEAPLSLVVQDPNGAQAFWGQWLDGSISDNTIYSRAQGIQRARVLMLEQSMGLRTVGLTCYKLGIQAGQKLQLDSTFYGIHDSFIVQQVETLPKAGAGDYMYQITLGAWPWNAIDVFKQLQVATQKAIAPPDVSGSTAVDNSQQQIIFMYN